MTPTLGPGEQSGRLEVCGQAVAGAAHSPATTALHALCQQWRGLALAEGQAIRARDWTRLAAVQTALKELQPRATDCLAAARAEWLHLEPAERQASELDFQSHAARLLETERQNAVLLEEARRAATIRRHQLDQAARTARRLRASYGASTQLGAWSSFS